MFKYPDAKKGIERSLKIEGFDTNILLVVIPNNLKSEYPKLKQYLLSVKDKNEILSQFVVENTLRKKGAQSIHTKILLQMIAKRGNVLWAPSFNGEIDEKLNGTSIMGIDSSSSGGVTIMAGCTTINSSFSLISSSTIKTKDPAKKYRDMLTVAAECHKGYAKRYKSAANELIVFVNAVPKDQINLLNE